MSHALVSMKRTATPAGKAKSAPEATSNNLRIGKPDDVFEQEADRIADEIMAGGTGKPEWSLSKMSIGVPLQRKCACGGSGVLKGECEECKKKEATTQRYSTNQTGIAAVAPIVHEVLRSPGQPLEASTRAFMEPRFGRDFSHVRVHTNARAAESARTVNALAYTVGQNVVFGEDQYAPLKRSGQRLVAHELAHVVQQGAAKPVAGAKAPALASVAPMSVQRQGVGGGSSPISNVSLTLGPNNPNVVRQLGGRGGSMVQVILDKYITATGTAQVSGPDAGKYEFGFLQICRPFDVMRATYHESGAPPGPGKDLNRDGTNAIRKVQPALDGAADWFDGISAKGPRAKVDFSDLPDSPFEKSVMKNNVNYDISGVAAASFFFTAFAVRGPDGKFQPLKTFYWAFSHCEALPPGTNFTQPKVGAPVVRSPVATCPGCSENEPGFSKINDPRGPDTCVSLVTNAWGSVMFNGPGTSSINC